MLPAPLLLLLLLALLPAAAAEVAAPKPHILFFLIDDFGWADAGWHRPPGYKEVLTPNMDSLVGEGIELTRNYVFKFCSPTRSAIQSGRNPVHVNAQNVGMESWDPANPLQGVSGIPVNMTGFATRMAEAGYKHRTFAGKADFGMAYAKQSPMGRGYTDALFYFQHMNDYFSLNVGQCFDAASNSSVFQRDLFGTNPDGSSGPQYHLLNPKKCWVQNMTAPEAPVAPFPAPYGDCVYEEDLFTNFTIAQIKQHDTAKDGPMLAFHAAHSIHTPLEVVPGAFAKFSFITDSAFRRAYHAMVYNVDLAVGQIVGTLKQQGMYENTLIVLSADNGGPIYMSGRGGGNNYPLRGGKASNFEGGIRVNGFVSGGFVPPSQRGKKLDGLVTGWDWYSTFVKGIGGLDPTDREAAAAGLPPLDSMDQWPYLSGATATPPRTHIPIGSTGDPLDTWAGKNDIEVHGLIEHDQPSGKIWKLLVGGVTNNVWTGPEYPNATTHTQPDSNYVIHSCGFAPGCLFELTSDETEHIDVAAANPEVVKRLRAMIAAANATVFAPLRPSSPHACEVSLKKYHDPSHEFGWWGPFADGLAPDGAADAA